MTDDAAGQRASLFPWRRLACRLDGVMVFNKGGAPEDAST
jgi:hypothetical protein